MNKKYENTILVGMSGGVDSSVSAAILLEKEYNVIGVTIKPFDLSDLYVNPDKNYTCIKKTNIEDAKKVCRKLGIEHYVVDFSNIFKDKVAKDFINEYMSGRTPNPCVICNPIIKWGELLKTADELNAKFIATGHYANINYDSSSKRYILLKGFDKSKDQSYFLWRLNQNQLSRTIFPLGQITKEETRKLASKFNLEVYNKPDSQEVCFIPDDDYRSFLENVAYTTDSNNEGKFILNNKIIGKHKGFQNYTIGQRKGLGVTYKEPLYVKSINPETNTIELSINEDLYSSGLYANNVNFIKYNVLLDSKEFVVKIRYKDKGTKAFCSVENNDKLKIIFFEKARAITPGQSVVMYDNDEVVGGGIIESSFD